VSACPGARAEARGGPPAAVGVPGVEATNELPLSALTFGRGRGRGCSSWRGAGRRQRHSIAGQMSYLKMLGLGARGKLPAAAGLFSTAVISGSSSAPNLRVCVPAATATNSESLTLLSPLPRPDSVRACSAEARLTRT
jgi:hypothetical protein